MNTVCRSLSSRGARYVDVVANPNALGFYASVGFETSGRASTRFGPATRMTLDLGSGSTSALVADTD